MTLAPPTRPSLLIRLKAPRDERAWMEFVEIYEPLIARLARRQGLQEADADDLTQDVLRTVAGAIEQWNPDPARGSFRAWLFRITRNLIVNLMTARRRRTASYGTGDTNMVALLEAQPAPKVMIRHSSTPSTAAGFSSGQPIASAAAFMKPPGRRSGEPVWKARMLRPLRRCLA